ncbi:MAG: phosphoribosylaminoimidazolesuccinocarboxamide synthase [Xanthomonadales bacterium]|nr:phosphoribosylaminoimidazolesuccinocarboxamide synthase [Xanthomonadales bacterium]
MTAHDTAVLYQSDIDTLELIGRGKVRDIYDAGVHDLLIVTCDRLSAFDVVLPTAIPGKGAVLNQISNFWFKKTEHIIQNHLLDIPLENVIGTYPHIEPLRPRSAVVRKVKPLPVEAIVRGYLAGSGWKDYQETGAICGHKLPIHMEQAGKLPEPLFTPSTKAESGEHDVNITMEAFAEQVGEAFAEKVRHISIELYQFAAKHARERGIIIADTKFEFGLDATGDLVLIDEVLTPDSSRFWPVDQYHIGTSPPSFDKQFVRDYLETLDWDKTAPGPELPQDIADQTADKYREALQRLTAN